MGVEAFAEALLFVDFSFVYRRETGFVDGFLGLAHSDGCIGNDLLCKLLCRRHQFLRRQDGVDKALADLPADAFAPAGKTEEKAFDCEGGNCDIIVTDRSVKKQRAIAEQLIDEKWVTKDDKPREGMEESDYENVKDFIERLKVLKKFGVKTTDLYIRRFKCKTAKGDDGKDVKSLDNIEFKLIVRDEETGEAKEYDIYCVGCTDITEIAEEK